MKKLFPMTAIAFWTMQQAWAAIIPVPLAFSQYAVGTNAPCTIGPITAPPTVFDEVTCGAAHAEINILGPGPSAIITNTLLGNFGSAEALASSANAGHNESSAADAKLIMFFSVVGPPAGISATCLRFCADDHLENRPYLTEF